MMHVSPVCIHFGVFHFADKIEVALQMALKVSTTSRIPPFLAMEMMNATRDLEASGANLVHLEIGQPSTPPPPLLTTSVILGRRPLSQNLVVILVQHRQQLLLAAAVGTISAILVRRHRQRQRPLATISASLVN